MGDIRMTQTVAGRLNDALKLLNNLSAGTGVTIGRLDADGPPEPFTLALPDDGGQMIVRYDEDDAEYVVTGTRRSV